MGREERAANREYPTYDTCAVLTQAEKQGQRIEAPHLPLSSDQDSRPWGSVISPRRDSQGSELWPTARTEDAQTELNETTRATAAADPTPALRDPWLVAVAGCHADQTSRSFSTRPPRGCYFTLAADLAYRLGECLARW
ncbi:hypothetical protein KM043_004599 [Ampulex compressa]|nr:hypothetical protein KM043_004599 [Ampulex compressa]